MKILHYLAAYIPAFTLTLIGAVLLLSGHNIAGGVTLGLGILGVFVTDGETLL